MLAEPLWAVPYYLFLPFASMYMAALGVSDARIGFITSLGLILQFLSSLFSGAIIDKYGRRTTMLVFTLLSWMIPCALWASAQGYWYFIVAVLFNSMWRVTGNCFSCIIIEDDDDGVLVQVYAIFGLIGLLAGFLSPVAGFVIGRLTIVPAMRILYLLALVLMAAKALLLYFRSKESRIGIERIKDSRHQSLWTLTKGGWPTFKAALKTRQALLCVVFLALATCYNTVQTTFFPLLVTEAYGISDSLYAILPFLRSAVMLLVYLLISPHIRLTSVRRPLFLALLVHAMGLFALLGGLYALKGALWAALFAAACDAFAFAVLGPLSESLMAVSIPNEQRARINSLIIASVLLLSAPAGWLAGVLSAQNRVLPFFLNLGLLAAEAVIAFFLAREQEGGIKIIDQGGYRR